MRRLPSLAALCSFPGAAAAAPTPAVVASATQRARRR